MTALNVTTATTAELLAFFNANTGGAQVKKFADRKTAERRVNLLIAEMIEDGDAHTAETAPAAKTMANIGSAISGGVHNYLCPHCGVDLNNGVGHHLQEVNGKYVKHTNFEFECLACGGEFGPSITVKKPSVSTGATRPEMTKSLKLDRAIQEATTGHIYANACQVWKAGLVSSSQCDRLSATLYGAAKAGDRLLSVTINGHVFTLANKV